MTEVTYFHGTATELDGEVSPAHSGGNFLQSAAGYAYATTSEAAAWHYAELAWHNGGDYPRVYVVEPLGEVERDSNDNTFDGDHRCAEGWGIVDELPMPEDMGEPEDWA